MDRYGLVVVGAGQGGDPLARRFAEAGHRVALVERAHIGGSCTNYGCTPTKLLLSVAEVAHTVRRAGGRGVQVCLEGVKWLEIREQKDRLVAEFRQMTTDKLKNAGVEILRGEARFVGPRWLRVDEREIEGERIVLDVGTRAAVPSIPGLDEVEWLDNVRALDLPTLPGRLLILGGGPVAVEFAQMFRRLGSEVVLLDAAPRPLSTEDADVADVICEALVAEGVEIHSNVKVARAEPGAVLVEENGTRHTGTHLLIATGRTPNTEALDPAAGGIELDEDGYVRVDGELRTTAEGVWAIGDVKGGPAFTHVSYDDYRILASNLLDGERRTAEDRHVPWTIFTDPQVGHYGLTEDEAQEEKITYRLAKLPMTEFARAVETGRTLGFLKVLVGEDDQILGAHAVMPEGGEIMSLLQVAAMGRLPYTALRDAVLAHPTYAEGLNRLFDSL